MESKQKEVTKVRPIYIVLLIIAGILYIVNSCIMQSDICYRLCIAEHEILHLTGEHSGALHK